MIDPEYPKFHRIVSSGVPSGVPSGWIWVSGEANYQSFAGSGDSYQGWESGIARYPFNRGRAGVDFIQEIGLKKIKNDQNTSNLDYSNTMDRYMKYDTDFIASEKKPEGILYPVPFQTNGESIRDSFLAPSGFQWRDGII